MALWNSQGEKRKERKRTSNRLPRSFELHFQRHWILRNKISGKIDPQLPSKTMLSTNVRLGCKMMTNLPRMFFKRRITYKGLNSKLEIDLPRNLRYPLFAPMFSWSTANEFLLLWSIRSVRKSILRDLYHRRGILSSLGFYLISSP